MAETESISLGGGVNPVGNNAPHLPYYPRAAPKRAKKPSKLKSGEVVHGTILDVPTSKQAIVRLPAGTFRAALHGKLRKGDALYFKVMETRPSLILKVFAVSVKMGGVEQSVADMMRMLDLPALPFYIELISYLKKSRSTINRDEILLLYQAYHTIGAENVKDIPLPQLFYILFEMRNAYLPNDLAIFRKIAPLFASEKSLKSAFMAIEESLGSLPAGLAKTLRKILHPLKTGANNPKLLLSSFRLDSTSGDDNLYRILTSLIRASKQPGFNIPKAVKAAAIILSAIEAMQIWNLIASYAGAFMHHLLPFFVNGKFEIVRIKYKHPKSGKAYRRKKSELPISGLPIDEFTIVASDSKLGMAAAKGTALNKNLSLTLPANSDAASDNLKLFADELRKSLVQQNYLVGAITFSTMSDDELETDRESLPPSNQNFSIVV